jgi:arylsulfatase A
MAILRNLFLLCILMLASCSGQAGALAGGDRPNVILIMVDDLGYHDLSCYGHPQIKTPVLDKMASEGLKLTSFYTGATICTPSRMALLTGAYPSRLGWTQGVMGYLIPRGKGLNPKAVTIAEVFKSAGYETGISGKWHVGDQKPFLPADQGFDYSYYIKRSNNQTNELFEGEKLVEKPFKNPLLTEQFTKAAIGFIKRKKDKPFFLYLPYTAPHFPVQAHPDWKNKSAYSPSKARAKDYGAVVEEIDFRIGEILKTLKNEKIDKKTIVIFLSDNGAQNGHGASSFPFRGMKWDSLEGGTRVPFIIRYPGVIPAGQESNELIAAIDLLPSLSFICGIDLKKARKNAPHSIDGLNVWQSFISRQGKDHPRKDLLYWHGQTGFHAIRKGDWKLFLKPEGAKTPGGAKVKGPLLFNLANEDKELVDLSKKHPDKVKELQELAKKRLEDINKNILPFGG